MACGSSKYISQQANIVLSDTNLATAHVGISIFDPSTNKYLYNHQGDKYFIPASNTKLFTCYAAMKHLGDSLVGMRYFVQGDSLLAIIPTGDPTFLLSEYRTQRVYDFLKNTDYDITVPTQHLFNFSQPFGRGWTIDDRNEPYAAPRSQFPIYGNLVTFYIDSKYHLKSIPKIFAEQTHLIFDSCAGLSGISKIDVFENKYAVSCSSTGSKSMQVPFRPVAGQLFFGILADTLDRNFSIEPVYESSNVKIIHSQPTDSLLKPMMHRSDNFFAEQTLLMVSNEMTGVMNDAKIIDSLLKTDYKDLPQKPRWVDGSGLSRYNLFSPNDFVFLLNKMKNDFSWNRITTILATGGEGTISSYYINLKDRIFAKTGTLSNNVALSGFLITKHNKTLIFSVLVNNHMGNTTQIRRAVEKFITSIAEKY
jgi:D-alanyl-D-alanine carboxypeptidase/D-alanyl-D-alanine-endopeptidase (penicillin-binding protein 4)